MMTSGAWPARELTFLQNLDESAPSGRILAASVF